MLAPGPPPPESSGSLSRPLGIWLVGGAAVAGLGVAVFFDITLCPVSSLLGVPCPGCGLTRATFALLSGDVARALALHPLVPLALPVLAGLLLFGHGEPKTLRWATRAMPFVAAALVALLLGVWIARFFGAFGGPVAVDGPTWSAITR